MSDKLRAYDAYFFQLFPKKLQFSRDFKAKHWTIGIITNACLWKLKLFGVKALKHWNYCEFVVGPLTAKFIWIPYFVSQTRQIQIRNENERREFFCSEPINIKFKCHKITISNADLYLVKRWKNRFSCGKINRKTERKSDQASGISKWTLWM